LRASYGWQASLTLATVRHAKVVRRSLGEGGPLRLGKPAKAVTPEQRSCEGGHQSPKVSTVLVWFDRSASETGELDGKVFMANRSRPSQQKRHKERARQEKQKLKAERRLEAKAHRTAGGPTSPDGEDPDIAGIRPGPQPPREDEAV